MKPGDAGPGGDKPRPYVSSLQRWVSEGVLTALDARFAEAMVRLVPDDAELLRMAAALASRAVQRGHVCVDIARQSREPLLDGDGLPVASKPPFTLEPMQDALAKSALVSDGSARTPLVLDDEGRLYLYRYFDYERRLAAALRRRASLEAAVDDELLEAGLVRMFTDEASAEQREAARQAVRGRLSIVSGGPGTGKTTTVAKILALIVEQAKGQKVRIQLVAPTGKAAQRLGESLQATVAGLDTEPAVREAIPQRASTIHRALGYQPRTPTRFRHGRHSPMSVDVLLADEASMIDLAMMTKLVEAVPEGARLILLGDKDQLASVEAGAVLGNLCEAPRLAGRVSTLTRSFRFGDKSGIGALARSMSAGDAERTLEVLRATGDDEMPYGQVALHDALPEDGTLGAELSFLARKGFASFLRASTPAARLEALHAFRILCVHRRGLGGVAHVNEAVEQLLQSEGLIHKGSDFYDGRPIMITANDHQLGLFNGDIGVVCVSDGRRRAFFAGDRGPRDFPMGRLPAHETVFAMTVHKSQGSEMERVAVVLPRDRSPILTRELLYTAVTRARAQVDLFGDGSVLAAGLRQRIDRASGLSYALR